MSPAPPTAPRPRRHRPLVSMAGFTVLYGVAVVAGRATHVEPGQLAMAWPAAAVAIVWFLTLRTTSQHLLAVGAITVLTGVINQRTGVDPLGGWLFGPVNASQGLVGVAVLRACGRWDRPHPLDELRDARDLFAAAAAGGAVTAVTGGVVAWARFGDRFGEGMTVIGLRNTLSGFIIGAALLALPRLIRLRGDELAGSVLVCTAAVAVSVVVIGLPLPMNFALVPPLLLVAMRCGPDWTVVTAAAQGMLIVAAHVAFQERYAYLGSQGARILVGQVLVLVLALVGIVIALVEKERTAALAASRRDRDRLRRHMEAALVPAAHLLSDDDGTVRVAALNDALENLVGFDREQLIGTDLSDWLIAEDQGTFRDGILKVLGDGGSWHRQLRLSSTYGGHWVDTALAAVERTDRPDGRRLTQIKLQLINITAQKRAEAELEHAALYDELTGLANRKLWATRLDAALRESRPDGDRLALLFVDIDHFKRINDTYGHGVGDDVLREVAHRIAIVAAPEDTVARLGGDEFVVLRPSVSGETEAMTLAARIQEALAAPVITGQRLVTATTSIGVAVSDTDLEPRLLMRRVDTALYAAKRNGRARTELYTPEINATAERAVRLLVDLERGHRAGELTLHYQPIVKASTEEVVALEALLRWNHPERGCLTPADFLDVLAGSDLMLPVGASVLEQACHDGAALAASGRPLRIHVNMSGPELARPGVVDMVHTVVAESGIPPERLVLEITETKLVDVTGTLLRDLHALRALGIGLAVDDFGTGFSTLSHLVDLPVGIVKLDRSFVDNIATTPSARSVSSGVRAMSDGLGIDAIAEGVETTEQAAILRDLGYRWLQGYHYGRPAPLSVITGDDLVATTHR